METLRIQAYLWVILLRDIASKFITAVTIRLPCAQLQVLHSPLFRNPSHLLYNSQKRSLSTLSSTVLALDNFNAMMDLLREAAARVCGQCRVLLVQHGDESREVVTLLHCPSSARQEQPEMYQAASVNLPSVMEACHTGRIISVKQFGFGAEHQQYVDFEAFHRCKVSAHRRHGQLRFR